MKNLICATLIIVMLAACAADQQSSKPPPADSTPHPEGLYADSELYIRVSPAGPPVRLQSLVIGEEAASSNQPPPAQPVQKTAAQAGSNCPLDNSKPPPAAKAKLLQPKKGKLPGRLP